MNSKQALLYVVSGLKEFLFRNSNVWFALVTTVNTCLSHLRLLCMVTPRYLSWFTTGKGVSCNVQFCI